jgi:hypothetical protein
MEWYRMIPYDKAKIQGFQGKACMSAAGILRVEVTWHIYGGFKYMMEIDEAWNQWAAPVLNICYILIKARFS